MENTKQEKGTADIYKKARLIKEKNDIGLLPHIDYTDLIREAYLRGYNEGMDLIKEIYKLNK
jgi:hypothetical protein